MKTIIYITIKYWKKHKKSAFAVLFSGILLTAILFTLLMSHREERARFYSGAYDQYGHYEVMLLNSDDALLKALAGEKDCKSGSAYCYGKLGFGSVRFSYGTLSDNYDLWHIPLDEGRLPETENELAAVSTVLDYLHWVGKCGDEITLDGKTYTVTGIIGAEYGLWRESSEIAKFESPFPQYEMYPVPLIFLGEADEEPLYRIDYVVNILDVDEKGKYSTDEFAARVIEAGIEDDEHWIGIGRERDFSDPNENSVSFIIVIAWIGAGVAALSVFSVLRLIFTERQGRIILLRRIGMKKRDIRKMYAFECAMFTAAQTFFGLFVGVCAYLVIFAFKVNVLGEKPVSGFTDIAIAIEKTPDPFLLACLISLFVIAAAYVINALTAKIKIRSPKRSEKPRSLFASFSAVFRQTRVSVVQTVSLMLICFSVLSSYLFYTDNGKETTEFMNYIRQPEVFFAGGFDMEKNGVEEYYSCEPPNDNAFGNMYKNLITFFPFAQTDFDKGFDDEIAVKFPNSASSGALDYTFIVSENELDYFTAIDLSDEIVRRTFLEMSDEKFGNFFEEGNIGSKNMYRIKTKLAAANILNGLSDCETTGEINIERLNSGEEILVAYQGGKPPFEVGETIEIHYAESNEYGFGVKELRSVKTKIGGLVKVYGSYDEIKKHAARSEEKCNFLTTASGARALGLPAAKYTELFAFEEIDGSVFPLSAEMRKQALSQMKLESFVDKAIKLGGVVLVLAVMLLLGFSAYFNGIGLKIRQKTYEISIMRAVGMNVKRLRTRVFLDSIKIPLAASIISYGMIKLLQLCMEKYYQHVYDTIMESNYQAIPEMQNYLPRKLLFLDNVMWQPNIEFPILIMFGILSAATFVLTASAMKKFRGNIADDLNSGRTRQ